MTRSHKLVVATAMLLCGYGLALVVSGISDYLQAKRLVGSSPADDWDSNRQAQLVPDTRTPLAVLESAPIRDPSTLPASATVDAKPTWLAPVVQANWEGVAEPGRIPAQLANASEPASLAHVEQNANVDDEQPNPQPRARLTEVKQMPQRSAATPSAAASESVSPWDRWPRWDPPSTPAQLTSLPDADDRAVTTVATPTAAASSFASTRSRANGGWGEPTDAEIAGLRTHIVVDGDTLARLADRYLDDPELGDMIYQVNREAISDPALLPIGVVLKIPDRRMASSPRVGAPPQRLQSVARPAFDETAMSESAADTTYADGWTSAPPTPRIRRLPPIDDYPPATNRPITASW